VFIPADGQPMPGYEQARAEIEARGGNVQVASGGGIGGLFSWLFGGGADDAEESGGQEATTTVASTGNARGGRSGGPQAQEPPVEVADVGPEAVAKAKRHLPTGAAYASAPEPTPVAKSQAPDSGPDAVATAKRNLPTGPTYASASESAPTPPVRPQAVAELEQPNVASDASPEEPSSSAVPKFIAPLPPRKPADLAALAFADAPMPPTRPADLILVSKTDSGQGGGAFILPSNKGFGPAAQHGLLPPIITAGVDRAPTGALALAEGLSLPTYDDTALLARAAALTAPLPPMPIANVGVATVASNATTPTADASAVQPQQHGWVARTAALAAEDIAQLFGGVFKTAAPAQTDPDELRAPQQ
jgi:hypothetical protein